MSKKYDSNLVLTALQKNLDTPQVRKIMEEINAAVQKEESKKETEKKETVKKQWVIILSNMDGTITQKDLTGWVVQLEESASPHSAMDRIFRSADAFNNSKKGRMLPVKSVGEALESGGKYFKDSEIWPKTKTPVAVILTDNKLQKFEGGE